MNDEERKNEPGDQQELVDRANIALAHIAQTPGAWITVIDAYAAGRSLAMVRSGSNTPYGNGYKQAFRQWAERTGFNLHKIDEQSRTAMGKIIDDRAEFDDWYASLQPSQRQMWNHPRTLQRHFAASRREPRKTPANASKDTLKDENRTLKAELAVLKDELRAARSKDAGGQRATLVSQPATPAHRTAGSEADEVGKDDGPRTKSVTTRLLEQFGDGEWHDEKAIADYFPKGDRARVKGLLEDIRLNLWGGGAKAEKRKHGRTFQHRLYPAGGVIAPRREAEKPNPAFRDRPATHDTPATVTKLPDLPPLPPGRTPLLSHKELDEWADKLEIPFDDLQKFERLLLRNSLELIASDPKEGALWMLRELGFGTCLDFSEALSDALDEDESTE